MKRLNREETRGHVVNETIRKIQEDAVTNPPVPQSVLTVQGDLIFRNATTADRLPIGAAGTFLRSTGTVPAWAKGWTTIFKTADEQLTTNTVFQDDDALTFAVAANTKYHWRGFLIYNTPAAADFKFQWTGPASATLVRLTAGAGENAGTLTTYLAVAFSTSQAVGSGLTDLLLKFDCILQNGANPGPVTLQWAQNASSGTTTVYAGSYLEYSTVS